MGLYVSLLPGTEANRAYAEWERKCRNKGVVYQGGGNWIGGGEKSDEKEEKERADELRGLVVDGSEGRFRIEEEWVRDPTWSWEAVLNEQQKKLMAVEPYPVVGKEEGGKGGEGEGEGEGEG